MLAPKFDIRTMAAAGMTHGYDTTISCCFASPRHAALLKANSIMRPLHCCCVSLLLLQVLAVAEKRRTALKRKVTALQTSGRDKLAEAEKKLQKISSQASKLPDLSNVLRAAFMA